ncbi:MAG: hypothetical protein QE279_10145 [Rhodoferax sp.]|nr:hypothetical protein [Rhodoferax sp.]
MATAQNILDLARDPLNDDDKTRWPDEKLLPHLNQGLEQIRRARPDLFSVWTDFALVSTSQVPLAAAYHQNLADYIAARAFAKDDEEGIAKATAFFTLGGTAL